MAIEIRLQGIETVHAAPVDGLSFCACCDATPLEIGAYDRISDNPELVNCGRLSAADEQFLRDCTASTE